MQENIDELGVPYDPAGEEPYSGTNPSPDPSVIMLPVQGEVIRFAVGNHPEGLAPIEEVPPPPLETVNPEAGRLLAWLCQENGKRKEKHQNPLASLACHNHRVTITEGASPVCHVENKVGRNDPCPCGSNKKFKKCCGA